jgi:hypothetical protein
MNSCRRLGRVGIAHAPLDYGLRESRALRDRIRKPDRMRLGGGQALIAADMENLPPAKKLKIFKG